MGVKSIVGINPKEIFNQIVFTSKDIKPDAIKIGMLHSSNVIRSVLKALNFINVNKIILDPVMVAKGGTNLIDNKALDFLKSKMIQKAFLITPNIPEAEVLTNLKIKNQNDMIYAGNLLIKLGAKNVLIKGGHLRSKFVYDKDYSLILNPLLLLIFFQPYLHMLGLFLFLWFRCKYICCTLRR